MIGPDWRRFGGPGPGSSGGRHTSPLSSRAAAFPEAVAPSLFADVRPGAIATSAVAVSTVVNAVKGVIENTVRPLWVRGEVTDFKAHRSGHWYFNLRDPWATLRCVVWASDQRGMAAPPEDGTELVAYGQMTIYPARADIQLRVTAIEAVGDGLQRRAIERVRLALERDGLLALERKRSLPRLPRCLAVITSRDGAALHDIVAVARRRAPSLRIVILATRVQGEGAPEELCRAFDRLRRWGAADVVIVGRGGGAKEDLSAFNSERVARAVAACAVPTISAVGHEVDITLCDLVADYRAPTPSAAAEAAVPALAHESERARAFGALLVAAMRRKLTSARTRVGRAADATRRRAIRATERRRATLTVLAGQVEALSPLATLARGFAVPRGPDGRTLSAARDFVVGTSFDLMIRDGVVGAITSRVDIAGEERP
jgi:exodeoxyribonuclease VII large subunit